LDEIAHNKSLLATPNACAFDVGFRCFGKFVEMT